jgi:hypothetical protein
MNITKQGKMQLEYSAAFEGHKNIIAPFVIFVIVMFSSIYIAHS